MRSHLNFPHMEELALYGMQIPFNGVRFGKTQTMNEMSGHKAIKGPPQPLKMQPTSNPIQMWNLQCLSTPRSSCGWNWLHSSRNVNRKWCVNALHGISHPPHWIHPMMRMHCGRTCASTCTIQHTMNRVVGNQIKVKLGTDLHNWWKLLFCMLSPMIFFLKF